MDLFGFIQEHVKAVLIWGTGYTRQETCQVLRSSVAKEMFMFSFFFLGLLSQVARCTCSYS